MERWEEVEEEEQEEEEKEEEMGGGDGALIGRRDLPPQQAQAHAPFAVATDACSCPDKR